MGRRSVLITGCSSGIGRATARLLAGDERWTVFATARRPETIDDLRGAGCRTLALDVTDEASMRAAVAAVEAEADGVDALVNNAGYSQSGAVEEVPMAAIRLQFETNFFGAVRLAQLVLPAMRRRRWGRIVNVSSMGGRLTFPGGGFYHATKYALEAVSDVLRYEVAPFGVHVVLIEPGLIKTRFGERAQTSVEEHLPAAGESPYARFNKGVADLTVDAYEGSLAAFAAEPDAVARKIARALNARRPRTRYVVGASARAALTARRLLPDRLWDRAVGMAYPRPEPGE
jgi:NAD(P)-dependent dehydrogenase (short-subunit alcohol dehydrogenase family)